MRIAELVKMLGVTVFSLAWLYLWVYLLMLRNNYLLFYIFCLLISFIFLVQIIYNYSKKILYIEVLLIFLGLQFIPITYAGLDNIFGLDVYCEMTPIKMMLKTGHWITSTIGGLETSYYPAHHILVTSLCLVTNCYLEDVVRYLPVFFNFIVFSFYFLIMKKIVYCNDDVILLCLLCFSFTYPYTLSKFTHQWIVLPYFFAICYIFLKLLLNYTKEFVKYKIILIILIICLVYTHHFTRVMLLAYVLTFYAIYMLFRLSGKIKKLTTFGISPDMLPNLNIKIIFSVVLMLMLLFVAYFFNTYELGVLKSLKMAMMIIMGIRRPPTPHLIPSESIMPVRIFVFYYGLTIILLISMFVVLLNRTNSKRFVVLFLVVYAVVSLALHVFLRFALNIGVEPFRASLFSSPFMLVALFYTLNLKLSKQKMQTLYLVFIILLVIFYIVINLFAIAKHYIDINCKPEWDHNEFKLYCSKEDRICVLWGINHNIIKQTFGDIYIYRLYLYYIFKPIIEDYKPFIYLVNSSSIYRHYQYFYLTCMDKYRIFVIKCRIYPFPRVTQDMYAHYQLSHKLLKIYCNGKNEIYKIL